MKSVHGRRLAFSNRNETRREVRVEIERKSQVGLYTAGVALELESGTAAELRSATGGTESPSECSCDCSHATAEEDLSSFVALEDNFISPTGVPTVTRKWDVFWTDGFGGPDGSSYVWYTDEWDEGISGTVLVNTLGDAQGLDVDSNGTTVYFNSGGCVAKVDVDGSNLHILVCYDEDVTDYSMQGLCIYDTSDELYWVDSGLGVLYKTSLYDNDGSFTAVRTGFDGPIDVSVDTVNAKIYVSDSTGIHRFDRDGSDYELVLSSPACRVFESRECGFAQENGSRR